MPRGTLSQSSAPNLVLNLGDIYFVYISINLRKHVFLPRVFV